MIWRCDLVKQYKHYEKAILLAIKKVCGSGKYVLGKEGELFEQEFASYCQSAFGVGVASGTEALYLSLLALDLKEGDEVITSPFTPVPTVSSIVMAGARPVFVDIGEDYLLDVEKLKRSITKRTKVIMPVHLFGHMVEMDELMKIAKRNGVFVVEDACQAHGSLYNGKKAGAIGHLGCFSFYPTKNLGGYGDGGMITTDDQKLADKLRLLRDYGRDGLFTSAIPGVNSRLDEIQAAILRIKLRDLDEMNEKRVKLAEIYFSSLRDLPLAFIGKTQSVQPNYHVLTARCPHGRDDLLNYLKKKNIQTNVYYPISMHMQKAYAYLGYKKGDFPVSEKACKEVIAFPMYPELKPAVVKKICSQINKFYD